MNCVTGEIGSAQDMMGKKNWINMMVEPTKVQMLRKPPSVGRNEPCPCASGKKFKNCHLVR